MEKPFSGGPRQKFGLANSIDSVWHFGPRHGWATHVRPRDLAKPPVPAPKQKAPPTVFTNFSQGLFRQLMGGGRAFVLGGNLMFFSAINLSFRCLLGPERPPGRPGANPPKNNPARRLSTADLPGLPKFWPPPIIWPKDAGRREDC